MKIIGLSGYARSGKDEAAHVLVEEYGFTQVAFADKLRDFIYALNPIVSVHSFSTRLQTYTYLQDVIEQYGWSGYKETPWGPEIRRLLQRVGTESGRLVLWDTIWIDAAFNGLDDNAKVVVSDARFFNEFDAIRSRGGEIWRIERPGVGPVSDHPSETEAPNYKHFEEFLDNDGDLEDYKSLVRRVYERYRYEEK